MFKWSKRDTGRPTTPKMLSVSLPESPSPWGSTPMKPSISEKPLKSSFSRRLSTDRQSMTPQPVKTVQESIPDGRVSRLRSFSLSKGYDSDAPIKVEKASSRLRPLKPGVTLVKSKAWIEDQMERAEAQRTETQRAGPPLKSCLKNGTSQPSYHSGGAQQSFPSSHGDRSSSRRRESPLENNYDAYRPHRSRQNSFSDQYAQQTRRPSRSPSESRHTPQTPYTPTTGTASRYMKAYIKEVPLKDAAVALSWPLAFRSESLAAKHPPLYFDAAFDPRIPKFAINVYRGGHPTPLAHEEYSLHVSPHCFMPEMVIMNDFLKRWQIVVRNPRGVRCIDVFNAIYETYSELLTPRELAHIGEDYIQRCERSFRQRCADSPGLTEYNLKLGLRRIDLLRGRRTFKGLTPLPGHGNVWELHFDMERSHFPPSLF